MEFYTYLYLREDGTPYYVGKGRGRRAFACHNVPVPSDRERVLIQEFPSEEDAITAEIFLIAYYGRKDLGSGILRNLSDGGEGSSGHVMSEKHRKIMSEANQGCVRSEKTRDRMSASLKAKWASGDRKVNVVNRAFTNAQILEILRQRQSGALLKSIAEMFGVDRSCIGLICAGKTYRR